MRRFLALIAIPLLACLVLAGCGGSSKSSLVLVIVIVIDILFLSRELVRHGDRIVRSAA